MHTTEAIERMLFSAFPQRTVQGVIAAHECEECSALCEQLSGVTWQDVPGEFIQLNDDVLPLLSHDAYLAFLPAWLRQGLLDPGGPVAGMLLVNLRQAPDTSGFTRDQAAVVNEVARFIADSNVFGAEDPVNVDSFSEIERVWSPVAA